MSDWFPWERMPGETGPSWQGFVVFRDAGPTRTLEAVAKAVGKHSSTLGEFARRWDWGPRAMAWDAEVDRQRRAAFLHLQRQTIKKHVAAAVKLRELAMDAIDGIDAEALSAEPRDALAFLQAAVKIEQAALGLPSETINHAIDEDPSKVYFDNLDEEKLVEMSELAVQVFKDKKRQHLLEGHIDESGTDGTDDGY